MSPVNRSNAASNVVGNTLLTPTNSTSVRAAKLKRYAHLGLVAASALFFSACSSVPQTPLETQGATKYIKTRVASDRDDAEERASGKVVTSSTDLELTYDVKRGQQLVGVRFDKLAIPQGAKVKRAEVRFTADEADRGAIKLKVYADDSDNAARFEEKRRNLSRRSATSAKVTWQPKDWRKVGEHGGKQFTPDIAPLLQEVVNRRGWRSGNAFAVLFSSESKSSKRVAESYRGNKRAAPQLYVEYVPSSAGPSAPAPAPSPEPTPVAKAKSALYVSPKGSDANDGRSAKKPLKTLGRAAKLVKPGDTVYLRGGVHKGYLSSTFKTDGSKNKPITITSYPGERAIVDGKSRHWKNYKSVSSPTLFRIEGDHYRVQNLTLRNGAGRGLYLKGDHIGVRNVLTHNHHSDGIYLLGNYGTFEDSVSHSNNSLQNGGDSADGIKIATGTGHIVRNFLAYNNSDDGIDVFCGSKSLVEYSVSHSNGHGHSGDGNGFKLGCRRTHNSQNIARYNVAYKNRANNFDGNSGGGLTMLHNTSWKAGSHGFIAYAPKSSGKAPNVLKNNLSYQDKKTKGMSRNDRGSHNSWDLKISNPSFASLNPNARDFLKLKSSSKAVDAGAKLNLPFQGSAPDLGALEGKQSLASLLGNTVQALAAKGQLAGR